MIKVIAFDLDDTLWHIDQVIIRAEKMLKEWFRWKVPGFKYDTETMRPYREEVLHEQPSLSGRLTEFRRRVIETALKNHAIVEAENITEEAMEVFLNARNQVTFFAGALDTIAEISANYQLGALTNGNADIKRLGLEQYFSFSFSAEEVGAPKPSPHLFQKALSHTGVDAGEMVYVGDDRVKDIDAAKAVGLKTIWLRNARRAGPAESEPDSIIETIRQLPKAILSIENLG